MARATVQRVWPDGEQLIVAIAVAESFPDSVAECEASAERLYAAALDITLADQAVEDEDVL